MNLRIRLSKFSAGLNRYAGILFYAVCRTKGCIAGHLMLLIICISNSDVHAQDPALPPTNLGLANVFDGLAGKPGFVYQGYAQIFHTRKMTGDRGEDLYSGLKVNSLLQMHQFIFLSKVKLISGNVGFTVLVPVVQISAVNDGQAPKVNPEVLGGVIVGSAIQWSDKLLFDKSFSHRLELDVSFPVGNFDRKYDINPSAHAYTFGLYHALTFMLTKLSSLNVRNQLNYNGQIIGSEQKAGVYYNGNYSIDFAVRSNLRIPLDTSDCDSTSLNADPLGFASVYYRITEFRL